jgi:hypothetical protein
MANGAVQFRDRLSNLLGGDSFVLPPDRLYRLQPKYRVDDVLADLYELRSEIAHGRAISPKFREITGIVAEQNGFSYPGRIATYRYRNVLVECALFLLCEALRKILVLNLADTVAKEGSWRKLLQRPL